MRTHIELNPQTLAQIMALGEFKNKTAAVNAALQNYAQTLKRQELLRLSGSVKWEGDLPALRTGRDFNHQAAH